MMYQGAVGAFFKKNSVHVPMAGIKPGRRRAAFDGRSTW